MTARCRPLCVADGLDGKPLQQMEVATDGRPFAVIPQQLETAEEWEAAQRDRVERVKRVTSRGYLGATISFV